MLGFIDSDKKSLCSMVPSHLFQFIFLYFSATHTYQRANGYKLGRTHRSRGCWKTFCFYLCGTSKPTLQTSLTISYETLRLASPCHSLATVSDLLLHSRCIILSVSCKKQDDASIWRTDDIVLISILHFPALSFHIFTEPSQTRNHTKWRLTHLPARLFSNQSH